MPVMGPTYSNERVDIIYISILNFLQSTWNIQNDSPHGILKDWTKDREERNAKLKEAIRGLVELDSWENF
jgi:hypothetical protein